MRLSVITPSYNQGRFIKATIDSVLSQGYSDMEYLVMDGGSSDTTVQVLRSYGERIKWVSEKDKGQADAVNKGILQATGDIIGWLNSDDIYYPRTFKTVMEFFFQHPEANVVYGHADYINEDGSYKEDYFTEPWNYDRLSELCYICQPAVFFRREAAINCGLLNIELHYALDYEFWLRLGKEEIFHYINKKFAGSRIYADTKTVGGKKKAAKEFIQTVKKYFGSVSDRNLSDYAHAMTLDSNEMRPKIFDVSNHSRFISGLVVHSIDAMKTYRDEMPLLLNEFPYTIKPFRIGIDISRIADQVPGAEQYVTQLLEAMVKIDPNNDYLLYPVFGGSISDCFKKNKKKYHAAELLHPNVTHSTSFSFIRNHKAANVYTLYDLSFFEYPDGSTYADRHLCMTGMLEASLYADMFIAVSEHTKKVFLKYFPHVLEDRVRVIPLSYRGALLKNVAAEKELKSLGIEPGKPYWFCVGTIEPRKNIISLVRAYLKLRKYGQTFPLYLAGKKGWLDEAINSETGGGAGNDIRILGFVSESQLSALYRSCYALVYPSLYEGFGLPILEAMSLGVPVITSNTTSMPEVGGDAVLYVDPYRVDDIAENMRLLQNDSKLYGKLGKKGKKRAISEFSWEKTAIKTIQCYYEAVWRHHMRKEL